MDATRTLPAVPDITARTTAQRAWACARIVVWCLGALALNLGVVLNTLG